MKVRFVPQNVEFEIKPGESVMHVAQDNGLYIKSVCKGVPSCAECRVRVVEGEHNILPPGSEELALIGTGHFVDRRRLSCQLKCFGDITIDLSEQVGKEKGLIGGRKTKSKLNIKDDRVEDAHVVRAEEFDDERNVERDEVSNAPLVEELEPRARSAPRPAPGPRTVEPRQQQRPQQAQGPAQQGEGDEQRKKRRRRRGGRGRGPNGSGGAPST